MTIELMKGLGELRAELVKQIEAIDCLMNARAVIKNFDQPIEPPVYTGKCLDPNGFIIPGDRARTAVYFHQAENFSVRKWEWDPELQLWATNPV